MNNPKTNLTKLNGPKVRDRIQALELKHYWVAEEAGVHKTTLRRWLNGRIQSVKTENVARLAHVLNTEAVYLASH